MLWSNAGQPSFAGNGRRSVNAKLFVLWNLPCLPLMWILLRRPHNRLEFLWNSTGSWKSLRDSHSFHRTYG